MEPKSRDIVHAELLEDIARDLRRRQSSNGLEFSQTALDAINRRGVSKSQVSYAVPDCLDLRRRVQDFAMAFGAIGAGNAVALILDAGLTALGSPLRTPVQNPGGQPESD